MKTWANILLGLWLIVSGLVRLGGVSFPRSGIILAALGIVAGIFFFFADRSEKLTVQLASILLGALLVAEGLMSLLHLHFTGSGAILAVLSLAAGVAVLLFRR